MTDSESVEDVFAAWQRQMAAGTEAWTKAVEQMAQGRQAGAWPGGPGVPPMGDPTAFWRPFLDQQLATWARMQGSGPVSPDVLSLWKKFLDDWIASWSQALEKVMATDAFSAGLGKSLDQMLTAQSAAKETLDKTSKAALDAAGLPSKEQVAGIARQLMDLEDRIEALEDRIIEQAAARGGSSVPKAAAERRKPQKKTAAPASARKKKRGGPGRA